MSKVEHSSSETLPKQLRVPGHRKCLRCQIPSRILTDSITRFGTKLNVRRASFQRPTRNDGDVGAAVIDLAHDPKWRLEV
jgi:hypothetical protein